MQNGTTEEKQTARKAIVMLLMKCILATAVRKRKYRNLSKSNAKTKYGVIQNPREGVLSTTVAWEICTMEIYGNPETCMWEWEQWTDRKSLSRGDNEIQNKGGKQ
eukprot:11757022-Ditylum_brightwellii.AAC.1